MRPALLVLVAALLAPGAAAFSLFPTTVHVAPYRVGDAWQELDVEDAYGPDAGHQETTTVVLLQGLGHARDRFDVDRPTVDVRFDETGPDRQPSGQICHVLQGGNETVRTDVLFGSNGYASTWKSWEQGALLGSTPATMTATPLAYFWGSCPLDPLARLAFREGDRVAIGDLVSPDQAQGERLSALSQPAVATTFHGRSALRLAWDLADVDPGERGSFEATLADGLPGIVAGATRWSWTDPSSGVVRGGTSTFQMESYHPGEGAPLPPPSGAQLPERDPTARFVPADGALSAQTDAFPIAYPFAEALSDARTQVPAFDAFLREHPQSVIGNAWYDAGCRWEVSSLTAPAEGTDGCWTITVGEATQGRTAMVARWRAAEPVALPADPTPSTLRVHGSDLGATTNESFPEASWLPAETADSASLARAAEREGLDPSRVEAMWFAEMGGANEAGRYYSFWDVSPTKAESQGTRQGLNVNVDPQTGGVTNVYAMGKTTQGIGLLDPPTGGVDGAGSASALSLLVGPAPGAGLAVGAATGLALLLLVVKLVLLPLFTRLRRDRLLDNPIRARLHERVRSEPGIHRAELVEYTGIGEGATRHHLEQLVRHQLLVELHDSGFARYYVAGEVPPAAARREAILRVGNARAVYELYAREPHASLRVAAARLGTSAPSVHRTKKRLERAGLLPAAPVATATFVAEA
jgi:hypothetical protein